MSKARPTYDLQRIQALVRDNHFVMTTSAQRTVADLGISRAGVGSCVEALAPADFYKTMPARKAAGLWQDVYRPWYAGVHLYMKLQISARGIVVVISIKER